MKNNYNGSNKLEDKNVIGYTPLITPYHLKQQTPMSDISATSVRNGRLDIINILKGEERKLIVVGPCSIHNIDVAKDYAQRLKELSEKVKDEFVIVMRIYFEKPRTTIGWKGLIYEPHLDGREKINEGLSIARQLLKYITEIGMPAGTEFLDTFVPQYISDLISWGAIGARTTESPLHRQMASGLSMPIGFKNSTQGNLEVAINALLAAKYPHSFFGLDPYGIPSVVSTKGNPYAHIILRGSNGSANYDSDSVREAQAMLKKAGLDEILMIDSSHGNSNKNHENQPIVFENVIKQIVDGNKGIIGLMLESNLNEGSQKIPENIEDLKYGVSITDSCIGWVTTEKLILDAYKTLSTKK